MVLSIITRKTQVGMNKLGTVMYTTEKQLVVWVRLTTESVFCCFHS